MLLAGDVGGTKTLLGLYDHHGSASHRPRSIVVREFSTTDYDDLSAIISDFTRDQLVKNAAIDRACFGVAGPVVGDAAELTNARWQVEAGRVAGDFGIRRVALLNDLQAMAYGVPVLHGSELYVLQEGEALPDGHMAVIAAGTGLGEAFLHNVGDRFIPSPSEGGHADFAARTEREIGLLRSLIERFGRAHVERVVSGHGLVNIHQVTHGDRDCPAVRDRHDPDAPAAITKAALEGRCGGCVEALSIFVDAYGAEAGNLALRTLATAGVFVGGGIAPKILPALADGRFMRAFCAKAPFEDMLARIPVKVILNAEVALLGAAVYAAGL